MKKLIFVTQSKGGAGKSILTFLLAEKYKEAIILDLDDATKTTSIQLKYRKPIEITFLNSQNVIDRGMFNMFLEEITSIDNDLFICDLGASISEQLPYYLEDVADIIPEVLSELKIDLEIYNVVGGANIFKQTMSYLKLLHKAAKKSYNIKVYQNEYYDFQEPQEEELKSFVKKNGLELIPFTISRDKNESTQERIKQVLTSGKGIDSANIISKMYFKKAIENLKAVDNQVA
ncbi:hypothetical protein [Xanthocytophaga flava]|uniref:hypothetical protein n=1 Tax=Xanthocytophaga flava TaxID=3048013 RepID=UPI0028CFFCA3|nr:hypothetical protein [Xanthocytophaga flavus]MDJ1470248.1 hypothetical protein [Xanthocytophaga flavus]